MRRQGDRGGTSLVELLVGIALFGLISLSVGTLTRSGLEYLKMTEIRAELSRQTLSVLSRMSRELAESNSDTIRLSGVSEPPGIVFASPRGSGGITYSNNRLEWKRWVCYYWLSSDQQVLRVAQSLTSPTTFLPDPSPAGYDRSVITMASSATESKRLLARGVSDFSVQGQQQVTLSITLEAGEGDRVSRLTTRTTVSPRH